MRTLYRVALGAVLLANLTWLTHPAHARRGDPDDDRGIQFQLDLGQTLLVPLGDSNYKKFVDPSYAASLRLAVLFPLPAHLRLGPFFKIEGVAVNTSDSYFQDNHLDASYGRLRVLVGPHFGFRPIERLELWVRFGLGVDYLQGSVNFQPLNVQTTSGSSTAFTIEPELGATVRVWRVLTVGGSLAFPVAFDHDIVSAFNTHTQFTASDLSLTILVGARL